LSESSRLSEKKTTWVSLNGKPLLNLRFPKTKSYIKGRDLTNKIESVIRIKIPFNALKTHLDIWPNNQIFTNSHIIFSNFSQGFVLNRDDRRGRYVVNDTIILLGKVIERLDHPAIG